MKRPDTGRYVTSIAGSEEVRAFIPAPWIHVGQTQGRGKLDVTHQHAMPVKDIWLYPLQKSFRRQLTAQPAVSA